MSELPQEGLTIQEYLMAAGREKLAEDCKKLQKVVQDDGVAGLTRLTPQDPFRFVMIFEELHQRRQAGEFNADTTSAAIAQLAKARIDKMNENVRKGQKPFTPFFEALWEWDTEERVFVGKLKVGEREGSLAGAKWKPLDLNEPSS